MGSAMYAPSAALETGMYVGYAVTQLYYISANVRTLLKANRGALTLELWQQR